MLSLVLSLVFEPFMSFAINLVLSEGDEKHREVLNGVIGDDRDDDDESRAVLPAIWYVGRETHEMALLQHMAVRLERIILDYLCRYRTVV